MYTKQLDFWPNDLHYARLHHRFGRHYNQYLSDMNKKIFYFDRKGKSDYADRMRASMMSLEEFVNKHYRWDW